MELKKNHEVAIIFSDTEKSVLFSVSDHNPLPILYHLFSLLSFKPENWERKIKLFNKWYNSVLDSYWHA